jgi:hypothetical protein
MSARKGHLFIRVDNDNDRLAKQQATCSQVDILGDKDSHQLQLFSNTGKALLSYQCMLNVNIQLSINYFNLYRE